ncbi:MAG: hypothetical protein C3F06_14755, partial [Candidatus Methanoperedenaceae archaeon]
SFLTKWGSSGSGDGQFNNPEGIAVDNEANVYITEDAGGFEDNDRIQKFRYLQRFTPIPTVIPTVTPIPTVNATPTETPIPTVNATPTETPIPTVNATPTETPIPTVNATPTPTSGSPGSGSISSSGGGGGTSGENYSNILLIEKYDLQISKDVLTSYRFTDMKNPIMFVNITGNTSLGIITTSVEVLKDTSSFVKTSPDGLVYKNTNIWVGTSGFSTPKYIKKALIRFRVENSWIDKNNLIKSDINLQRWDGSKWIRLQTSEKTKDSKYTYFEGNTNSFSPFVITSLKEMPALMDIILPPEETPAKGEKPEGNKTGKNEPGFLVNWFIISGIFVVIGLIIEVLRMKRK